MVGITMHKVLAFTVVALTGVNALAVSTPCPEEIAKATYAANTRTKSSSAPAAYTTISSSTSTPCPEENGGVTYAGNTPVKSTSAPAAYSAISSSSAAHSSLSSSQASYSVISSIKKSSSAVSASGSVSSSVSSSAQVTSSAVSKSAVSSSATSKYVASSSAASSSAARSSSVSNSVISSSAKSSTSSSASRSMSFSTVVSSSAASSSAVPSSTVKPSSSVVSSSAVSSSIVTPSASLSSSAVSSSAASSSVAPSSSVVPSSSAPAKPSCTPFIGLKNPSFEAGLAPWNKNNGATLVGEVVEATTPAGTHVFQGSLTTAGSATWQIIQGSVMIQSGTTISCSALFKSLVPGKVTYTMLVDGRPCGTTVPTNGDFAQPTGSIQVIGDTHTILIRVLGATVPAGPVFQLDNIQLTSTAGPGLCGGQ